MPSDYKAITERNITELGTKTSTRKTQICMYSDRTHFIYELLQNADDYGATEVYFNLTHDHLTLEHNGEPFTAQNVTAITSFGESTSQDDMLKTGRFGVGFKSVFAFTATPIVVSGEEHFRIHGLYRVEEYPYPSDLRHGRTRIILPFNHETQRPDYVDELMPAQEAYALISERLTGLNRHTLLFTQNIREIRWEIGTQSGHYLREDTNMDYVRRTTIADGSALDKYLVFSRTPTWRGRTYKEVEIAFSLDDKEQITAVKDFLYVLFCTTQETHLQFILNGPYKTNPSRETISEEDAFNKYLMRETCVLLTSLLPQLRDRGLLTTQFLGILPNTTDDLRPFYVPILTALLESFQKENLLPTSEGEYAKAQNSFQGPAALRDVISTSDLAFLARTDNASWVKGVAQNTRPDQFLRSLNIRQWGYPELQRALSSRYGRFTYTKSSDDAEWLAHRSDEWLQKLYMLLGDAISRGDCNTYSLQGCAVIRVVENKVQEHVTGDNAYFPKRGYRELPQIKTAVLRAKSQQLSEKLEQALIALGVREIGEEERIDSLLESYYGCDEPRFDTKRHLEHMRLFIKWWKREGSARKFAQESIFRVVGSKELLAGSSCYLDTPLKATGLHAIFKEPRDRVPQRHRLWSKYQELKDVGFCDFAVACGAYAALPIARQSCDRHPSKDELRQDYDYGVRYTSTGINRDFIIPGVQALLRLKSLEINQLIWDTLRKSDPEVLEARFRPNQQYTERVKQSSIVLILSAASWIPDASGNLHKPQDLTRKSLHPAFRYDDRNGWLSAIGFAENAKRASAEYQKKQESAVGLGLNIEIVELIGEFSPDERAKALEDITSLLKNKARQKEISAKRQQVLVPFHQALSDGFAQAQTQAPQESPMDSRKVSLNPDRRQEKLEDRIAEAIESEPASDGRFTLGLRKKWKGKNDEVRRMLIQWYGGRCQICDKTFHQHNGEPYFEGIYLVSYTTAEWIDRPGNVLCLCPWHSAMFQYGSKRIEIDIVQQVLSFTPQASGGNGRSAIDLILCGDATRISFHEDHLLELKVMIQESQKTQTS